MQFVVEQHGEFKEDQTRQVIDFERDDIILDLPKENVEDWKINPLKYPKVICIIYSFL